MNGRTDSEGDNVNALERLVEDRRKSLNISECFRNPLSIRPEREPGVTASAEQLPSLVRAAP